MLDSNDAEAAKITIPPFEVAVLKTAEVLCLPRYLIARWNIRNSGMRIRAFYGSAGLKWTPDTLDICIVQFTIYPISRLPCISATVLR